MDTQSAYPQFRRYYKTVIPILEKPKVAAYTMAVLSFFTLAIFGAFAIRPTVATIVQLNKKIEDQKTIKTAMEQKITQLRVAQAEYENVRRDFEIIFAALPQKPQTALLLGKLNRSLVDNNIDIIILQFSAIPVAKIETVNEPATIKFTITGKASYDNALQFVSFLSRIDRVITLDSIDIAAPARDGGSAISSADALTITIQGRAYAMSEKKK